MNVIVFGATGKTGRHVLNHALDAGHNVTAFTRSPAAIDDRRISVAVGDVLDPASVRQSVAEHDAAIVVLGSTGLRDRSTLSVGTKHVVDALSQVNGARLIVLSAAGVGESWSQVPMLSKVVFKTMLRNIYADHIAQEALVRDSALDWIIVRAAVLNDSPGRGSCDSGDDIRATKISRDDVAKFMVEQLSDDAHLQQAVTISW